MVTFSSRLVLGDRYRDWITWNKLEDNAFNAVTFLEINDLLDEDKVNSFLASAHYVNRIVDDEKIKAYEKIKAFVNFSNDMKLETTNVHTKDLEAVVKYIEDLREVLGGNID